MAKLTEGEWAVLDVLWQGESFPLGEIVSALEPTHHWRRSTVHTYLTRMEAKGLVTILRQTEPHRYAAAVSRDDCARQGPRSTAGPGLRRGRRGPDRRLSEGEHHHICRAGPPAAAAGGNGGMR